MADPLSLTLAAVTLATTVKDLVKLAQNLERSFAKVSENFRNAETLAAEIRQTLEQLEDFCDEHNDILSNANDMERSLVGLMQEMKSVYEKSCEVVHNPSERKLDKLKVALGAWRNRKKVESRIRELRNRVNKCHTKFMLFAIMRIEKRLVALSNCKTHEVNAIRNEITNAKVPDARLAAFMGTNSTPLSTFFPETTADLISDDYLRLQIHVINQLMVQSTLETSYPNEEPISGYLLPFHLEAAIFSRPNDRSFLRQDIISETHTIQTLLRGHHASVSLQIGAWFMIDLSTGLFLLEMYHEAIVIGEWTVKLLRTLITANPTTYSPHLSLALQNLCLCFTNVNKIDSARSAINESLLILQDLEPSFTPLDFKLAFADALVMSARVSSMEGESSKSLQEAQDGIMFFEDMFVGPGTLCGTPPMNGIGEVIFSQALADFPNSIIYRYVQGLHQLSTSLEGEGRLADAAQQELTASEILVFLIPLYAPGSLELELARTFYRISHSQFRQFISLDRALPMSQQAVSIFRKYFQNDGRRYGRSLCNALWHNGKILGSMKRYDEALAIWKETAALARVLEEDQLVHGYALQQVSLNLRCLNRNNEAASIRMESVKVYQSVLKSTSVTEAHAYYDLAVDLQLAGRYSESIRASQMAISQYRALAFNDADQHMKDVAQGLNLLTDILIDANQLEQAFNEGHEALKLYEVLIHNDPGLVPGYIWSLTLNSAVTRLSRAVAKSIERSEDVIRLSRELVKRFPSSAEEDSVLIEAIINHSLVLSSFDRYQEAGIALQEALDWYDENPAKSAKPVIQHMHCLNNMTAILNHQGHTDQALIPIGKAIHAGQSFYSDPAVASMLVGSMYRRAQLFLELGRYAENVHASEEATTFARNTPLEGIDDFIGCLQVESMAYKYSGRAEEAVDTIQEALELCRGDALKEMFKTIPQNRLHLPLCLHFLSESFAAAGNESEALAVAQEALVECMKLKSKHTILPWSNIEPTYMDIMYTLSIRLAANNDLLQALELIRWGRTYYEERAQGLNSLSRPLACHLRAEAIFHCAAGQHEEGIAARSKLDNRRKRLEGVFPGLARLVEIELDAERNLTSWITLVDKLDLQCQHQYHGQILCLVSHPNI